VVYDANGLVIVPAGSVQLSIKTVDPVQFYAKSLPPFKTGRVYPAIRISGPDPYYLCWLPARGDVAETITRTAGGITLAIDVDGQGNIIDARLT